MSWPAGTPAYTLPFGEYDDEDDQEGDTPPPGGGGTAKERAVRRRSSKACDQCRKSKCKCERPASGEPCRSCVLLGTECTSLGPSRKRGPPKGYIDAIEARLHQTEALVGILLAAANYSVASHTGPSARNSYAINEENEDGMSRERGGKDREVDERARGLLGDLAEDPLARSILARIDQSAYGPAGRASAGGSSLSSVQSPNPNLHANGSGGAKGAGAEMGSAHPSHEWMDRVTAHVLRRARLASNLHSNSNQPSNGFDSPVHPASHQLHPPVAPNRHLTHSRSFEHTPPARSGSGRSTPNGLYPYAPQLSQLHPAPPQHSPSQISMNASHPPQRPAIITAFPQGQGYHPLSAGAVDVGGGGGPASARSIPLSAGAGSEGRRLRRRVDGGPAYRDSSVSANPYREGSAYSAYREGGSGFKDSSAYGRDGPGFFGANANGTPSRSGEAMSYRGERQRSRSYSSGSEAELDVDVPHASPPQRGRHGGNGDGHYGREGRGRGRDGSAAEGLAGAVGQLSLNEDDQVRYHGKVSGLHLLARREPDGERARGRTQARREASTAKEGGNVHADADVEGAGDEEDGEVGRNVGGIWRFPKARVWPAAPEEDDYGDGAGEADADGLPPRAVQEALLARYFTHVHPSFPVLHKRAVLEAWERGDGPPPLLLLAMYALAARHAPQPDSRSPAPSQYMWPAGDAFLFRAKALLDSSYASSRASTCQALLLMGFREIGIGAMASAWLFIGIAVRMAQDLGMQRDADGWVRAGVKVGRGKAKGKGKSGSRDDGDREGEGERMVEDIPKPSEGDGTERRADGKLFGPWEIAERRRIWYACVIMDKYVSTYIGRPLAIFDRDFDTSLPSESDAEEMEDWTPPADAPVSSAPRAGHVISCFNASARLSGILSHIVQAIYALRPAGSRHAEQIILDGQLEKWRLALPPHLQHDPARSTRSGGASEVPLPQVLTLHMQYWCAVLLLHRPFIRQNASRNKHSPAPEDGDVRGSAEKSYELCAGAANHITTIATLYSETYTLKHCAVFLCYYIFTAGVMHVTSLFAYPTDPQARLGLTKCMDSLKEMEIVWPAAGRALELLRGAQGTLADAEVDVSGSRLASSTRKRSATQPLNDTFAPPPGSENLLALRQFPPAYTTNTNGHYGLEVRDSPAGYYPPPLSPYERWPTENGGALAFQGALSTAVMGPAYSTGLGDERHRPPPHEAEPRFGHQEQQQYWHDYAAFPPLGPGYGELQDPALAAHPDPQIYPLHEFSLYNQNHHGP
ncbi:fungal-specific transcription factor domain-containing protein [Mycena capillaripes]|nr:fungal-specific transcription factor domain-containing protein [Mycena capillaripes]